jgi:uncharacterized protein
VRNRYDDRPLATAAVLLGVLAVLRVGGAFVVAALVASILLTPAVALAATPERRREMGLRLPTSLRALLPCLGVVLLSYAVTVGACVLLLGVGPDNWASGLLRVFDGMVPATAPGARLLTIALVVLTLGVVVPLAEEVCFRGFLLHAVACRAGTTAAVVTSSGVWAVVHLGDYGLSPLNGWVILGMLPSVFVMGLALAWCRLVTGSVVACAAAQGVANLALAAWVATW